MPHLAQEETRLFRSEAVSQRDHAGSRCPDVGVCQSLAEAAEVDAKAFQAASQVSSLLPRERKAPTLTQHLPHFYTPSCTTEPLESGHRQQISSAKPSHGGSYGFGTHAAS